MTKHALIVLIFVMVPMFVRADPLEDATRDAAIKCSRLGAMSLDDCGTQMVGASAAHSSARMAVRQVIALMFVRLNACRISSSNGACAAEVESLMGQGMWDAQTQFDQSVSPIK